ncbi:MAG: c-type cytochrome [Deltaproteobacteria bacterium]|nr:c-type cytochrome [Deltaproteobacteria bacterium]
MPVKQPLLLLAATFVCVLFAKPTIAQMSAKRGDLTTGKNVYNEICFACHGVKGDGKGPSWFNTKPSPQVFINSVYMSRLTDEYMFNVVKYGKLAVLNRQIPNKKIDSLAMPAFGAVLEDNQIRELIKFERAFSKGGPQSAEMREIFEAACMVCHGKRGQGDGERASAIQPAPKYFVSDAQPSPMNLTDPQLMARFNDDFLFSLIKKGKIAAVMEDKFDTMQPFGQVLSDKEIWSVIRYVRETFVNSNKEKGYAAEKRK